MTSLIAPKAPSLRWKRRSGTAKGAVTVDGKMVDYANIRMIRRLMSFKDRE